MKLMINADVGEGLSTDPLLYPYLDQASIACGGHAGNEQSMQRAVKACIENSVQIGAHISYPDRDNFGRVSMQIESAALLSSLRHQMADLQSVCDAAGAQLAYVKPHGALYNDLATNSTLLDLVLRVTAESSANSCLMINASKLSDKTVKAAQTHRVQLIPEAFADRLYLDDGSLCPRSNSAAVHSGSALIIDQCAQLFESASVTTSSGDKLTINAESICLHGDNPAAVSAAAAVSELLKRR